ncbi:hypothetical protein Rxycam_00693 [Rubrobacter xylanophilus DSM 9941]|nr:hypothetical protein Rxycam_00693 [Rubrobacter xylanophilus DSM 9941]
MAMASVAVVGAGPGGVAAARRLRGHARVVLVERRGEARYLPGTIPTLLGETPAERWSARLSLEGVEVVPAGVREVSGKGVRLEDGTTVRADAVIASPGLALDVGAVPEDPRVFAFWDPDGAGRASRAVRELREGVVAVVVSSLPYRCPPAPYGLAMQLAGLYRALERDVRVFLTTPEEEPLEALGEEVSGFLRRSCAAEGVELLTGFRPELDSLAGGDLRSREGSSLGFDLALVVPPHRRSSILAELPGEGPLVEVSSRFGTAEEGLYVVGDVAATGLPRAADAAAAAGVTAAEDVLRRLGLLEETATHLPAPECYLGHGGGCYSRISLRYPDGLPPQGRARIAVEGPSTALAAGFEEAFHGWRALREEATSERLRRSP